MSEWAFHRAFADDFGGAASSGVAGSYLSASAKSPQSANQVQPSCSVSKILLMRNEIYAGGTRRQEKVSVNAREWSELSSRPSALRDV